MIDDYPIEVMSPNNRFKYHTHYEISPQLKSVKNKKKAVFLIQEFYGSKCCILLFIIFFLSVCFLISALTLLLTPATNKEYLNNIRLHKFYNSWNKDNSTQILKIFKISVKIVNSYVFLSLDHKNTDPYYKTSYYTPGLFLINFSKTEKEDQNSEIKSFQENMGNIYFDEINIPIGPSTPFCLKYMFELEEKNLSWADKMTVYPFKNQPNCNNIQQNIKGSNEGIEIIPWLENINKNISEKNCRNTNGFYKNFVCYKYSLLKEICIKISIEKKTIFYEGGCLNNTSYLLYEDAKIGHLYDFKNLTILVRYINDPYILIKDYEIKNGKIVQFINNDLLVKLIDYFILGGSSSFIFIVMIYLILITLGKKKFVLTDTNKNKIS